jgi:hypothetical protein
MQMSSNKYPRSLTLGSTRFECPMLTNVHKKSHQRIIMIIINIIFSSLCFPTICFRAVADTPRKRTFPYPPGFQSAIENNASSHKTSDVSSTSYPSMIGGGHHSVREGRSSTSSQSSCDSGSSFDPSVTPPMLKRSREDFDGKEGKLNRPYSNNLTFV